MRRPLRIASSYAWAAVFTLGAVGGCGDDDAPANPADSSVIDLGPIDASGAPDAGEARDATPGSPAAPAALPVLTPCPPGWREIPPSDEHDVATCDPWPEGGRHECALDEAHVPGEPDCVLIGSPCSLDDDWAVDLPTDRTIRYVRAGATGGTGSREAPYGTAARALSAARDGDVVALSRGTYDGIVTIPDGVTLFGACVAETLLRYAFDEPPAQSSIVTTMGNASLRNLRVRGTNSPVPAIGVGIPGSSLQVDDVVIEGAFGAGLIAVNTAEIRARNVVVQSIAVTGVLPRVGALLAVLGGRIVASRIALHGSEIGAVHADGPASTIELEDAAIYDFGAPTALQGAGGASAMFGSHVVLRRVVLEQNGSVSLRSSDDADGVPSTLDGEDIVVRDTVPRTPNSGFGFYVRGGEMTLRRVFLERTHAQAGVVQTGGSVTAEDLVIRDTVSNASGPYTGRGLEIQDGAIARLTRALFARNREVAIHLVSGATLEATDLSIVETLPNEDLASAFGLGMQAEGASTVTLERASIAGNHEHGIALLSGTNATLRDVEIRGTSESACTEPTRCVLVGGVGLAVVGGSHVLAERFALVESGLAGLHIAEESTAELLSGWIAYNPIGMNVAVLEADVERLVTGVQFVENGDDVQSQSLPIPAELESLSGE